MNLKPNEQFLALKVLLPDIHIIYSGSDAAWKVVMPRLRTSVGLPEDYQRFTGPTTDAALRAAWIFLAWNPRDGFPEGSLSMPAEQNCIIVPRGKREAWMRWGGFMWETKLEQDRWNRMYPARPASADSERP